MELEAKFQVSDSEPIKQSIQRGGFEATVQKQQIDHYYIVGETDEVGFRHYFRLREDKLTEASSLDYHQVRSEFETEETEVSIENGEEGREILRRLGYNIECVVDKQRAVYERGDVVITIDQIDSLGTFVEIEMEGTLTAEKEQRFDSIIKRFDLNRGHRVKNKGYPELIIENQN
ncbi:class IV adenylate cyclase [Halocatena halophila]|uniref:class IV adenylate cyclase n=1 Tax=Halocatena halophila TaxID=2814576 RepID=UPI002ED28096